MRPSRIVGSPHSNIMPGVSDEGDVCNHGCESAIFQDLEQIREKYGKWLAENLRYHQFYNDEMIARAQAIDSYLSDLADELNTPL